MITDRYIDSSLAYQGAGRGQATADIARLNSWATDGREPDLTILLDMDPGGGAQPPRPLGRPARGRAARLPPAGPGRVPRAGPRQARATTWSSTRRAPLGEITEQIKDRIREVLPDPVPRAAEAATGSFAAIPDHVPTVHGAPMSGSRGLPGRRRSSSCGTRSPGPAARGERLRRAGRAGSGRRAAARGRRRGDDARLAVHRPARLRPVGRGAGVRGRAAVPVRRLRRVPVVPSGARGHARRPAPRPPRRPFLRGEADQGPGAARGGRAVGRPLARGAVRRRRPVHRGRRQRAAQGDRGTRAAHGLAAVRAVGRGPGDDDQVPLPGDDAAGAAVGGGRRGARRAGRDRLRAGARRRAGRAGAHRPGPAAGARSGRRRAPRGGARGAGAVRLARARRSPRRPRW